MFYFFIFFSALILSATLTILVRKLAIFLKIVDLPSASRKIHTSPIPLLGGLAIFIAYFGLLFLFKDYFLAGSLKINHLWGFFFGGLIIISGGFLDDKYNLPPRYQVVFPLLAILAVIFGGVEIAKITNPFGGFLDLNGWFLISPLLIAIWLLGLMYTTKLLDGVDGLVSGLGTIGALIIFLFTLTTRYYQPDLSFAAILLAGAISGFLIFNFNPAKIFLGEGGSLLIGYLLGVLAVISGGKIAIALLVMGIPILDVAWTIIRRLLKGKNPFRFADREHLHHRFLALGLSQKQTVFIFYSLSLIFGLSGLFLQSRGKLFALLIILGIMFFLVVLFWRLDRRAKTLSLKTETIKTWPDAASRENVPGCQSLKPALLFHICCAPCGAYLSRERLLPVYNLTWYFYNPNLNSQEEYDRRLAAVKLVAEKFNIPLIIEPYSHKNWLVQIKGQENTPEKGKRCQICYRDRLEKTARLAQTKKFDFFSTSLLVSPYKDTEAIKKISLNLAQDYQIKFLDSDFQADNGYQKSQNLAKELGIYRQKFCGCEYSFSSTKQD